MVTERKILARDAVVALRRSCLNCTDCTGRCWPFFEMLTLPGAILKSDAVQA